MRLIVLIGALSYVAPAGADDRDVAISANLCFARKVLAGTRRRIQQQRRMAKTFGTYDRATTDDAIMVGDAMEQLIDVSRSRLKALHKSPLPCSGKVARVVQCLIEDRGDSEDGERVKACRDSEIKTLADTAYTLWEEP